MARPRSLVLFGPEPQVEFVFEPTGRIAIEFMAIPERLAILIVSKKEIHTG